MEDGEVHHSSGGNPCHSQSVCLARTRDDSLRVGCGHHGPGDRASREIIGHEDAHLPRWYACGEYGHLSPAGSGAHASLYCLAGRARHHEGEVGTAARPAPGDCL